MIIGNNLLFGKPIPKGGLYRLGISQDTSIEHGGLMIAIPIHGSPSLEFAISLTRLALDLEYRKIPAEIVIRSGDSLVTRARNTLAAIFLAGPYERLLMIDADTGFEVSDVVRLLQVGADKDLLCGLPPLKMDVLTFGLQWLGPPFRYHNSDPTSGAFEILACGMAFALASKAVFHTIAETMPHLKCRGSSCLSEIEQQAHHAWFDGEVHDSQYYGEDIAFCRRWRETGGKVWVLPDLNLRHEGGRIYRGSLLEVISHG